MGVFESRKSNTDEQRDKNGPPELQFTVKKLSDLEVLSKSWAEVELPIDILLTTVDKYGFLCCFHYLREVFKSFQLALGHVYFGEMGKTNSKKLQIALIQCCEGGGHPGGAGIMVPKAVEMLRPKAVFCVGSCAALYRNKPRLGDVVAAAKLTTYAQRRETAERMVPSGYSIPASKSISKLIPCAAYGWKPPLKNPEVEHEEVKVHSNGEILSGPEEIASVTRRDELVQLYPNAIAVEMDGDGKEVNKIIDLEQLHEVLKMITQESGELNYQGHLITYHAVGRMHKLVWVYDGMAWDVESGNSLTSRHWKSKHGAIKHAIEELIDVLKVKGLIS